MECVESLSCGYIGRQGAHVLNLARTHVDFFGAQIWPDPRRTRAAYLRVLVPGFACLSAKPFEKIAVQCMYQPCPSTGVRDLLLS
jgi:hypothetical protein